MAPFAARISLRLGDSVLGYQILYFAAAKYLREFARTRPQLTPVIEQPVSATTPASWNPPKIAGRDFVTPDDIKSMATPVLEHRITPGEI